MHLLFIAHHAQNRRTILVVRDFTLVHPTSMGSPGSDSPKFPRHNICYLMRRDVNTGELTIACPFCDIEAHGGGEGGVRLVAEMIASKSGDDSELD